MFSMDFLVKEFLFDCRVRSLSEQTILNYKKQLGLFVRFLETECKVTNIEDLKPLHIKLFIRHYQERQCKPSYVNDNLKAVKTLCAYAQREGYVDELITKNIKNVKEPKVLIHTFSPAEISKMIKYYDGKNYTDVRNKMILMILFDTGIRVSELMNMKPDQIQDEYFVIYGKGRKERVVPKNPIVAKFMYKYMAAREKYFSYRNAEDYVFLSKTGRKLTEEAIRKMMIDCARAVKVNPKVRVSPHTCRHTFAHQQLKNGLDLYSLSRLLGHESVTVTQRYLESMEDSEIINNAAKTSVLARL